MIKKGPTPVSNGRQVYRLKFPEIICFKFVGDQNKSQKSIDKVVCKVYYKDNQEREKGSKKNRQNKSQKSIDN